MPIEDRQQGKIIRYSLADIEGDESAYMLTFRQARALLSTLEYFRWLSRHLKLPDDLVDPLALKDWVDDLAARLMKEVPDMTDICELLTDCSDEILSIVKDALDGTNTSDAAQALKDLIDQNITNIYNKNTNGGNPLNPTVTVDTTSKLFGECVKIVEYTHDVFGDVLEQLETVSNNVELLKHGLDSIPFLKYVTDALPADAWLDDIDYFISIVSEDFEAGYTVDEPDGSKFKMACAIYCACESDKTITVERIFNGLMSILATYTIPSLDNFEEWLSALIGVNDNTKVIVYSVYTMLWGVARLSSFFGTVRLTDKALELVLKIGEQDTSRDPSDYCFDCTVSEYGINTTTCGYDGQDTGFTVTSGNTYEITASTNPIYYSGFGGPTVTSAGTSPDPFTSGVEPTLKCLVLMVRIGDTGAWVEVGAHKMFTAYASGTLRFTINEADGRPSINTYADNSGIITVTIS